MTVYVEELTSDVTPEPEPSAGPVAAPAAWQLEDNLRALRQRLARDAERTRAEGYSD
jgi:hypothetical protein